METIKVRIQRVTIHSFKNIKNLSINLFDGDNLTIEGKNGLGKSNILNAIYWCLNGADTNGCVDNAQFVPFRNSEFKVDVEVQTNVGKFERIAETDAKGTTLQTVKIDDLVYTLKDFDIELDKRFGILGFTLNSFSNKDFKLREFLMNPTYHSRLAPKTIRDILAKRYSYEFANSKDYKYPQFTLLFLDVLKTNGVNLDEVKNFYEPIESVSAKLETKKKELKKELEENEIVYKYLSKHLDCDRHSKLVEYIISEIKESLKLIEQDLLILDSGRQTWNELLERNQSGTLRVKFQQTTAKGIVKNDIAVEETGINLRQVSTSENTMDSLELIDLYLKGVGCAVDLPIFIDRAESINADKLKSLKGKQVILTKVTSGRKIKINGTEID